MGGARERVGKWKKSVEQRGGIREEKQRGKRTQGMDEKTRKADEGRGKGGRG